MVVFLAQVDDKVPERDEVEDKRIEKLLLNSLEVAVPKEFNQNSDLT
jgi:hypothetical protein